MSITINLSGFEVMRTRGTDTDFTRRLRESLEDAQATLGAELIASMRRSLILDIDDSNAIDGAYTVKAETREPAEDEPAHEEAGDDTRYLLSIHL